MRPGLAAVGVLTTAAQILLLRELAATFYGNELVYGLALAIWLVWTALGARLAVRFLIRPAARGRLAFAALLVATSGLAGCQIVVLRGLRLWLGFTPGAMPSLLTILTASAVVLAPVCFLGGSLFTLGSRLWAAAASEPAADDPGPHDLADAAADPAGRAVVGRAYAWESAGSVTAGLTLSLLALQVFSPLAIVLGLMGLVGLAGAWIVRPGILATRRTGKSYGWCPISPIAAAPSTLLAVLAFGCLLAARPLAGWLEQRTLDWAWPDRVAVRDTPRGRLVVVARDSQRAFFQDGRLLFETQSAQPEEVAHLPLLAHPNPRRVLLIGGGIDGTLAEILKQPVDEVVYAELDPWSIRLAQNVLTPSQRAVFRDQRVHLRLTDGRRALRELRSPQDVVIVHLPEPATGQLNRFYSREFFAEAKAVMAPDGLLAFQLPGAESYWNPALAQRNASIKRALEQVFASVVVTAGESNTYLASPAPLVLDAATLAQRLENRRISTRWLTASRLHYVLDPLRRATLQQRLAEAQPVPANRDGRPVSYFYELALWLSRAGGPSLSQPAAAGPGWAVALVLALLALGLGAHRGAEGRLALAVATAGFSVMALEVVVLLAYQCGHGALYQQLGLLVAAFMAGMAFGAARAPRASWTGLRRLQLGLAAAGLAALALSHSPARMPPPLFAAFGLAAGALGGALFAVAATLARGSAARIAGRLYAIDLVGAAAGAVLSSLLLVPLFGISASCALVAVGNAIFSAVPGIGSRWCRSG